MGDETMTWLVKRWENPNDKEESGWTTVSAGTSRQAIAIAKRKYLHLKPGDIITAEPYRGLSSTSPGGRSAVPARGLVAVALMVAWGMRR